jgi:hypothetical protein
MRMMSMRRRIRKRTPHATPEHLTSPHPFRRCTLSSLSHTHTHTHTHTHGLSVTSIIVVDFGCVDRSSLSLLPSLRSVFLLVPRLLLVLVLVVVLLCVVALQLTCCSLRC